MSSDSIWYISKYVACPSENSSGGRAFSLMKNIADGGKSVTIITSDSNHLIKAPKVTANYKKSIISGVEIFWLKTFKYEVAKSFFRIVSFIDFEYRLFLFDFGKLNKPDIIVISSLSLLSILNGLHLKRRFKCKLIFEVRDIWPLTLIEEGGFSAFNPFIMMLGWVEWIGYKYSDEIVGTMPNLKEHVERVLGYERRVHCIPMGVDIEQEFIKKSDNHKLILPRHLQQKFIVAYAGTVGITNALQTFLEAASKTKNQEVSFVILGDGALLDKFRNEYEHINNLTFLGKVEQLKVDCYLRAFDVLYFSTFRTSIWNYGQSLNKLIDYMLAGKPIIGSYSGFPSMVNEADCGTFVPAENVDALLTCIDKYYQMSPAQRKIIGDRGTKWVIENRNYAKLAELYLNEVFLPH